MHGAWGGSWVWEYLIHLLEALEYAVETINVPSSGTAGTTQFDDAAHIRAAVDALTSAGKRVVVVAHSYGAQTGSAAVKGLANQGVLGLINLCGYIYPEGFDSMAFIEKIGGLPWVAWDTPSPGFIMAKDAPDRIFGQDTPQDRVDWAMQKIRPQSMAASTGIVPCQAWQDDAFQGRLGYIRATADLTIPLDYQDQMLEAGGGEGKWVIRTIEGCGHMAQLSRPDDVAAAIHEIINEFETKLG